MNPFHSNLSLRKAGRLLIAVSFAFSTVQGDLATDDLTALADRVFKGGEEFPEEDIRGISQRTDLTEYHRVMLEVQMLASVDDESRYQRAIALASGYIEEGSVPWARTYFSVQRSFLYQLAGDREEAAREMEQLIDQPQVFALGEIEDPFLARLRKHQPDFGKALNDRLRHSLGFYDLDFRKQGPLPEEAMKCFAGIANRELRQKALNQWAIRTGRKWEETEETSKAAEERDRSRAIGERKRPSRLVGEREGLDHAAQHGKRNSVVPWIVGLAVLGLAAVGILRLKRDR